MSVLSKDPKDPAYPPLVYNETSGQPNGHYTGITIRDYFAAKAMQAMITQGHDYLPHVTEKAYEYADAMLKERGKNE